MQINLLIDDIQDQSERTTITFTLLSVLTQIILSKSDSGDEMIEQYLILIVFKEECRGKKMLFAEGMKCCFERSVKYSMKASEAD